MGRRAEETLRAQQRFAAALVEIEEELGDDFHLQGAIGRLLGTNNGSEEAPKSVPDSSVAAASVTTPEQTTKKQLDPGKPLHVIVCEPIPADKSILKKAANYHHFRTIYAAQKLLNQQMQEAELSAEVKISMANHTADIPRHFRRNADQICCVIFGPNMPRLTQAWTVRMIANADDGRLVVVCYNPDQVNFSWDQLEEIGVSMDVRACRATADADEVRQFWSRLFTQDLRPLVERMLRDDNGDGRKTGNEPLVCGGDPRAPVSRRAGRGVLPGFPHICRLVMEAIEAGRRYAEVADIVQPDGSLQASIIRTSNLARYGAAPAD